MITPEDLDITDWPRVTQVLSATGISDFSKIRNADFYLQRGQDIHLICESIDKGESDWWSDGDLAGYANAYQLFKKETGFIPELIEHPVFNEVRKYRGTLDRTGRFPNRKRKAIVDIKSGVVADWTRLQTIAYANCLPNPEEFERYGLSLAGNGKYKLTAPFDNDLADRNYFFSLVNAVHGRSIYGKAESWEGE